MGQDSLTSHPFFHLKFCIIQEGKEEGKKERKKEKEGGRKRARESKQGERKKKRKERKNELSWVYSSGLIILHQEREWHYDTAGEPELL